MTDVTLMNYYDRNYVSTLMGQAAHRGGSGDANAERSETTKLLHHHEQDHRAHQTDPRLWLQEWAIIVGYALMQAAG
jgi:hypothetical protein